MHRAGVAAGAAHAQSNGSRGMNAQRRPTGWVCFGRTLKPDVLSFVRKAAATSGHCGPTAAAAHWGFRTWSLCSPVEVGVCGDAHDPRARQRPKLLQKSDVRPVRPSATGRTACCARIPPAPRLRRDWTVSPHRLGSVANSRRALRFNQNVAAAVGEHALERLPQGFTVLQDVVLCCKMLCCGATVRSADRVLELLRHRPRDEIARGRLPARQAAAWSGRRALLDANVGEAARLRVVVADETRAISEGNRVPYGTIRHGTARPGMAWHGTCGGSIGAKSRPRGTLARRTECRAAHWSPP